MNFTSWMNSKIKKFDWLDIQFIKISVFGFTLLVAKIWSPLLDLDWYWYALIFILATVKLSFKAFRR